MNLTQAFPYLLLSYYYNVMEEIPPSKFPLSISSPTSTAPSPSLLSKFSAPLHCDAHLPIWPHQSQAGRYLSMAYLTTILSVEVI